MGAGDISGGGREEGRMTFQRPNTYESSCLAMHHGDDDCPICRFLEGEHETATLLHVIAVLDGLLAARERQIRMMVDVMVAEFTGG